MSPPGLPSKSRQHEVERRSGRKGAYPSVEQPWFKNNQMSDYTTSTRMDEKKHLRSIVWLPIDIHTIFDAKRFGLVPKKVLLLVRMFRRRLVRKLTSCTTMFRCNKWTFIVQCLCARFAYTVFEFMPTFLESGRSRKLLVRVGEDVEE